MPSTTSAAVSKDVHSPAFWAGVAGNLLEVDADLSEITGLDQGLSGCLVEVEGPVLVDEVFFPLIQGKSLHVTIRSENSHGFLSRKEGQAVRPPLLSSLLSY
jgi:hypothetical protein